METAAIVKTERYKAYAKEVEGILLYWVPEIKVAGLHQRGLMRMLGTGSDLVRNVIASLEAERRIALLEAEVQSDGGIQGVRLISETDLPKILRRIERSKAKDSVKDLAGDLRDRLASVGMKLLTMYHVVPEELCPELKPEPIALSPGRAALLAAGDDPIAIAKASREHFPDLATSMLPVDVHAAQIIEARRYVR